MTGAGMMDCKKALSATDGDMDKAVEFLREKDLQALRRKLDVSQLRVSLTQLWQQTRRKLLSLRLTLRQTSLLRTLSSRHTLLRVAAQALTTTATDMDAFMDEKWTADESLTVKEALSSEISIIGENMSIRRFKQVTEENGFVSSLYSCRRQNRCSS